MPPKAGRSREALTANASADEPTITEPEASSPMPALAELQATHPEGPQLTAGTDDPATPGDPVLDDAETARRVLALTFLQAALTESGVQSTLARNHRLVLRYSEKGPIAPSGQTDPRLYIFLPAGTRTATTNGTSYLLDNGHAIPADDPATAAALIQQDPQPLAGSRP
jgi:hypothetical protein